MKEISTDPTRTSSGSTTGLAGAAATDADVDAVAAVDEDEEAADCCCTECRRLCGLWTTPNASVLPEVDAAEVEVVPGHRRQLSPVGREEEEGRAIGVVRGVVDVDATDDAAAAAAAPPPPPPPPAPLAARIEARERDCPFSNRQLSLPLSCRAGQKGEKDNREKRERERG